MHDLAAVEHDGAFAHGERQAGMLLDQQKGEVLLPPQPVDALEHDVDDDRRQALERLVHQQHGGVAHERPADGQICCSPPDSSLPLWRRRSASDGKRS